MVGGTNNCARLWMAHVRVGSAEIFVHMRITGGCSFVGEDVDDPLDVHRSIPPDDRDSALPWSFARKSPLHDTFSLVSRYV